MKKLISFLIGVIALMPILATAQATYVKQATLIYPKTEKKVVVEVGSIKAQILLDSGYQLFKEGQHLLGFSVITDYAPSLTLSLNSTATIIPVSTMTTKDGTAITMSLLGSKVYLNIEPGGSNEEIVVCTGISVKTFTGCTRGLAFSGLSETAVLANKKSHNAGSQVIMSNVHYVYNNFVDLDTNQTITGYKSVPTPSSASSTQIANVSYVNSVAYAGSPNAAEGVKGVVDLATQSQMATGASAGASSSLLVLQSKYASSTSVSVNHSLTSYPISNSSILITLSSIEQYVGESFKITSNSTLNEAQFYLMRDSLATGTVSAILYLADTGTLGVDAKPSSFSAIATSTPVDVSTISTSTSQSVSFTFSDISLTSGTNYAIILNYNHTTGLMVSGDNTSPTYEGNFVYSTTGSTWSAASATDIIFYLNTNDHTTIPITNSSGKIDPSFLNGTESYTFNGTTTIAPALTNIPPVGSITAYATSTAPTGWKLCDGSALATSTYSSLFSVIGYTFGGNGTSTFALPDLRGRQITMASSTASYATSTGIVGGESAHTQTVPELAAHSHTVNSLVGATGGNNSLSAAGSSSAQSPIISTNTTGSSTPFNVLDPYLTLNYIIKY